MITKEEYINARNIMIAYENQLKEELLSVTKDITGVLERDINNNLCLANYVNTSISVPITRTIPKIGISKRVYNALKRNYISLGISPEPTLMDLHKLSISKFAKLHLVNKKSIDNIKEFAKAKNITLLP